MIGNILDFTTVHLDSKVFLDPEADPGLQPLLLCDRTGFLVTVMPLQFREAVDVLSRCRSVVIILGF